MQAFYFQLYKTISRYLAIVFLARAEATTILIGYLILFDYMLYPSPATYINRQ